MPIKLDNSAALPTPAGAPFSKRLKQWRHRRGLSQLRLALQAGVSSRHLAFLETGRARPTAPMVLRLADALNIPRADRNSLLQAAGFASIYEARSLEQAEMAAVKQALLWTLERHSPYPAYAFDRHWNLIAMNKTAQLMLAGSGIAVGDSLLDALTSPGPIRQSIENWNEVAFHLLARLRTESRHLGGDATLDAAAIRLEAEIGDHAEPPTVLPATITTRYRMGDTVLALFSTIAQFGSAEDIALADLKIEMLFPADAASKAILENIGKPSPP